MDFDNLKSDIAGYKKNIINSLCYSTYGKKIDENLIYVESMDGEDFSSNILRIVEELSNKEYGKFKIIVYAKKECVSKVNELQENYGLNISKIISSDISATRVVERAKYIVTDSKIRFRYVKKDNQIIINVPHKNPMNLMGMDIENNYWIADMQHPLLLSDYIVISNDFAYDKIFKSSLIENIYPGKILREGSPRNVTFFRGDAFKSKFNLKDKKVFVYMPSYWGLKLHKKFVKTLKKNLKQLDKELTDNQVLFIKVEDYNKNLLNLSKFKHIKPFPKGYDEYDIINMADIFVTDYSSVALDFINCKRKIILFDSDKGKYSSNNPNYREDLNLPFINVDNISDLVNELNSNEIPDYSNLFKEFCPYDNVNSAHNICQHIFLDKTVCKEEELTNNKPNVLIYAGGLGKNELTLSIIELLSRVDTEKYNFFVTFRQWGRHIPKTFYNFVNSIPKDITILPMRSRLNLTLIEKIRYERFLNSNSSCNNTIRNLFNREFKKQFYNMEFDYVLNFETNYKPETLLFYNNDAKTSFWIHKDIDKEVEKDKLKTNFLKEASDRYDNIVVDASELVAPLINMGISSDKICQVHNVVNYEYIEKTSKMELIRDLDTEIYSNNPSSIKGVLNNSSKKIIAISRRLYDEEWCETLLYAFDEFCEDNGDVELIIMGEVGSIYKLKKLAFTLKNWQKVTIIRGMSNYLPVLKECDLFILRSHYKSYMNYIFEADCLKVPVITTDVEDVEILDKFNGHVFENSKEGLLDALNKFMDGKINKLNIDYDNFNENSVNELYSILK